MIEKQCVRNQKMKPAFFKFKIKNGVSSDYSRYKFPSKILIFHTIFECRIDFFSYEKTSEYEKITKPSKLQLRAVKKADHVNKAKTTLVAHR